MQSAHEIKQVEDAKKALKGSKIGFWILLFAGSVFVAVSSIKGASIDYLFYGLVMIAGSAGLLTVAMIAKYRLKRAEGV